MNTRCAATFACAFLLAACGGVHHTIRREVPQPATLAVLPFGGEADAATREATRALLQSRLAARGYRPVEANWVDRVLAERGWLRDPAKFDPAKLPMPEVIEALGVDAAVVGTDFDETRFNIVVLRRHAFGGTLAVQRRDGVYWTANHAAGSFGGFLLTSGQVFEELRAQGNHGTPMATLALVDEFVSDVVGTVPARTAGGAAVGPPELAFVSASRAAGRDGSERLTVEGRATPGCTVTMDVLPAVRGVPMVAVPGEPGRYRGAHDLEQGVAVGAIALRARTAFGTESRVEVKP